MFVYIFIRQSNYQQSLMFFPGIMPKRKASLPNPQAFTTIQTSTLRKIKFQIFTSQSYTNNNRSLKTQASPSYRAKKNASSPQKTRADFKSNLTSFYQKHLSCFDQQKQTIKLQKERKETAEAIEISQRKLSDKNDNKLYFIVKRRQNMLNLSKRSNRDTINNLRNNKAEVLSKQTPGKKDISTQTTINTTQTTTQTTINTTQVTINTEKQIRKSKRYMELSLSEIVQADCPSRRYSPLKNKKDNQTKVYEGW